MFKSLLRNLRLVALGLLSAVFGYGSAQTPVAPDAQRGLTIYQIMVASFQHSPEGAPGYTAMWGPDGHTKNGNIKGITESLDYIASLGVNAIWLTPIFDSSSAFGGEKLQATGYFTNNFFKIDPNFGTESDFKEMVDSAHARGLYVILDGVFGHHGGVVTPSPKGNVLDSSIVFSDRGEQGGSGNIAYPGSLEYIKELATYYIENYGIDGWRLDQAYQATQGGRNYWNEIRAAVEEASAARAAHGEQWGTLGYMVGEDWGPADVINRGVYRDGGLLSAFDFDGKELLSGAMQQPESQGLVNGWEDVQTVLSAPTARGYLNDNVIPNLFLTNHDGYRVADHLDPADPLYYARLKTLNAVLAAYSGPITLYYGDEYADRSIETQGAQPDNIARTSGHLEPRNEQEADLRDYISAAMRFRRDNPAMWRGKSSFTRLTQDGADILIVVKSDPAGNVAVIFSDSDAQVNLPLGIGEVSLKAYEPLFLKLDE